MTYESPPNPYYSPEKMGLTVVFEIDDPEACYSFDMVVLWRHETGRLYWAADGGCSCPAPFEDYKKLEDLHELTSESLPEMVATLDRWCPRAGRDAVEARANMLSAACRAIAEAAS
jgi:hypothetical protein